MKHPPDQTLETMEVFLRGIVLGFTQGDIEGALEQWLSSEEGRDCMIPSVELRYQTHNSESKIDAMIVNSKAILKSWGFILEKRSLGREMFALRRSVSGRWC